MKNIPAFPLAGIVVKEKMPLSETEYEKVVGKQEGMTLRDWFAGQVIGDIFKCADRVSNITRDNIVAEAFEIADAMLIEREKEI